MKRFLFLSLIISVLVFGSTFLTAAAVGNTENISLESVEALFSGINNYANVVSGTYETNAMYIISGIGIDGLIKPSQDDGLRFIEPPQLRNGPGSDYSADKNSGSGKDDGFRYVEPPWFLKNPGNNFVTLTQPSNNKTITSKPVTFKWKYGGNSSDWAFDIEFELNISVMRNGETEEHVFYIPSSSCSKGVCSYKVNNELGSKNATVTWFVMANIYTESGLESTVSNSSSFKLNFSNPTPTPKPSWNIEPPVLKEPNATLNSRDMGFYWYPSKNAEYYEINWWNDRGNSGKLNQNQTDSTCSRNLCIVKTTLPSEGNYSWNVRAWNSKGYSATSDAMSFRVTSQKLFAPAAYRPNGTISAQNYVAFEWQNIESGVTQYRLQVVEKNTGAARLDAWYGVNSIYKANGICYLNTNLVLTTGTYSWRVKAKNNSSESDWSSWVDFYVYGQDYYVTPSVNTVPSPIYPVNTISELNPHFEWKAVTGASYYQLNIYNQAGSSLLDLTVTSASCTSGTCSYTPNFTLPGSGSYRWIVTTYGNNGGYWGYAEGSFTVNAIVIQQGVVFITPTDKGFLDPNTRKIIWADPGAGITSFQVEIQNNMGNQMLKAELTRENALCDGITCSIQFRTIPNGKDYKLILTPCTNGKPAGTPDELIFSVQ